jgi:DNA-binding response OmpR family regulator
VKDAWRPCVGDDTAPERPFDRIETVHERVLIVEDEAPLAKAVRFALEDEGFRVAQARDGEAGLKAWRENGADLVILDVMLPKLGGLELCRRLRKDSRVPIVFLSARGSEVDRVVGLELGADDYVTKPFSVRELCARVKAILQRCVAPGAAPQALKAGSLELDERRFGARLAGRPLVLGLKEFELLRALLRADGCVLSRDALLESVWGYEPSLDIQTRTIDQHVKRLRKKLGPEAWRLSTVKGVGYRLEAGA